MIEQRERKIYLKDLLFNVLSKWISILVGAVVVGVLVIAVKYKSDSDNYELKLQNADIEKNDFTEGQLKNIEDYIRIKDRLLYYSEYYENSYLMSINPANVTKLRVRVLVDSEYSYDLSNINENDYTSELIGAYTAYFSSVSFAKEMMTGLEEKYVKELVNVSYDYDIGVISIIITIPDSIDGDTVYNNLNQKITSLETSWQDIGKHTIRIISSSQDIEYDSELENKVYNTRKSISDSQIQLTAMEANLSASEMRYIGQLYGEEAVQSIAEPAINIKYGIIGIVLGAVLMVFFYIFASILSNKLQNAEDIRTMYGVNMLGKLAGKGKQAKADTDEIAYIVSKLKIMCHSKNIQRVHITGSNISKINDNIKDVLATELKKSLEEVTIGDNICTDAMSLEKAKHADNVILVEALKVSHYDEIAEQLQLMSESDIELLGVITVG